MEAIRSYRFILFLHSIIIEAVSSKQNRRVSKVTSAKKFLLAIFWTPSLSFAILVLQLAMLIWNLILVWLRTPGVDMFEMMDPLEITDIGLDIDC